MELLHDVEDDMTIDDVDDVFTVYNILRHRDEQPFITRIGERLA